MQAIFMRIAQNTNKWQKMMQIDNLLSPEYDFSGKI